jgi:hypothetical protein
MTALAPVAALAVLPSSLMLITREPERQAPLATEEREPVTVG